MNATPMPVSSEAHLVTAAASRYLAQLCKHFQHRLPVTLEAARGRIDFPAGVCELDAATHPGELILRVSAGDEAGVAALKDVVARHLVRFAFREELAVDWTRIDRN
jgi:hypothetical protein